MGVSAPSLHRESTDSLIHVYIQSISHPNQYMGGSHIDKP